jgi:N-acetylglucosaminyl-diphospho-decaprenol L-rhamnosyltransferase
MDAKRENQNVVSVVSHGDGQLVVNLLQAIRSLCDYSTLRVIVTVNIPEQLPLAPDRFPFPVVIVRNDAPKGYGANHNAAFKLMQGDVFSVLNPDIRLTADPFVVLTERLGALKAGVVAPLILSPEGQIEDSVRRMITPLRIVKRVCRFQKALDYEIGTAPIAPDWVAGMFLMFSSRAFAEIGGFDERYYMYCEDADICARLSEIGQGAWLIPSVKVIHDAHRQSHRDPRHFWWHINSLARFCTKHRSYRPAGASSK